MPWERKTICLWTSVLYDRTKNDQFSRYAVVGKMYKRVDVNWLPSLRGSQPFTVLPLSTSTKTLRPSIFLPSACLYAAVREGSSHWSCPYLHPESAAYTYTRLKVDNAYTNSTDHTYNRLTHLILSRPLQTYSRFSGLGLVFGFTFYLRMDLPALLVGSKRQYLSSHPPIWSFSKISVV